MTGRHESPPVGSAARDNFADYTRERLDWLNGLPELADDDQAGYVCDRCGFPAVLTDLGWQHAEIADAAFCQLVMRGGR